MEWYLTVVFIASLAGSVDNSLNNDWPPSGDKIHATRITMLRKMTRRILNCHSTLAKDD
jgi:hypothetical protein